MMGGWRKAGGGDLSPMLIHSLFPRLIHMLFGHNTSRPYDSSIKAASFAFTSLQVICQHYGTLMCLVVMPAFLEVNSQERHKSV